MKRIFLVAALIGAAVLPAAAQRPTRRPMPAGDSLRITDQQRTRMRNIREKYGESIRQQRSTQRDMRERMRRETAEVLSPAQRERMQMRRHAMQRGRDGRAAVRGAPAMRGRAMMHRPARPRDRMLMQRDPRMGRERPNARMPRAERRPARPGVR